MPSQSCRRKKHNGASSLQSARADLSAPNSRTLMYPKPQPHKFPPAPGRRVESWSRPYNPSAPARPPSQRRLLYFISCPLSLSDTPRNQDSGRNTSSPDSLRALSSFRPLLGTSTVCSDSFFPSTRPLLGDSNNFVIFRRFGSTLNPQSCNLPFFFRVSFPASSLKELESNSPTSLPLPHLHQFDPKQSASSRCTFPSALAATLSSSLSRFQRCWRLPPRKPCLTAVVNSTIFNEVGFTLHLHFPTFFARSSYFFLPPPLTFSLNGQTLHRQR